MQRDRHTNGPGAGQVESDPHGEVQSRSGEATFHNYRKTPQELAQSKALLTVTRSTFHGEPQYKRASMSERAIEDEVSVYRVDDC